MVEEAFQHYHVTVGDETFTFPANVFHQAAFVKQGSDILLQVNGREYRIVESSKQRKVGTESGNPQAPMAGKIIQILVQPGDEVILPDFTMIATLYAVLYCQAKPVFVDVEPDTRCIGCDQPLTPVDPFHTIGNMFDQFFGR